MARVGGPTPVKTMLGGAHSGKGTKTEREPFTERSLQQWPFILAPMKTSLIGAYKESNLSVEWLND